MAQLTTQQAFDLALQHHQARRAREAEQLYRQILSQEPNHAGALHYSGVIAAQAGRNETAVKLIRQALLVVPHWPEAYSNLGIAFRQLGQVDQAIAAYRQAIALRPNYPEALGNLGNALKDKGLLNEAIAAYRQALSLKPGDHETYSNLLLSLHYHPDADAAAIAREHRQWNERYADPLKKSIRAHFNNRSIDRRLRIGYFSPDFHDHVVGQFLLPLLTNHDRKHFEIFAYAHVNVPDEMTQRLRANTDFWRNLVGLSDSQAAELIQQDHIDILVDLAGHTASGRLLIFARKPAPVQVSYMGYANTTGVSTMDYRLTDIYLDPPGIDDSTYTERSIRLPETYWCYQASALAPEVSPLPAERTGYITFSCLNNPCKVSKSALLTWCQILKALPNSRLILYAPQGALSQQILDILRDARVDPARVQAVGRRPSANYLANYQDVDIALDPFPYTGYTTSFDALWMGVPIVSLAGSSAAWRGGVSILSNLGLPELIANEPRKYAEIAIELASDLPRLKNLRSTLRQRMKQSPLMDAPRFVRNVEAAYRQMWREWCEKPFVHNGGSEVTSPVAAIAQLTIEQSFDLALQHHKAGHLNEAEHLYRQILAQLPTHAGALHYLGVTAYQVGRHQIAVHLIQQAIALVPNYADAYDNLGSALKEQGQLERAIAAYRQAIVLRPNSPETYSNLGLALQEMGELDEAITAYRRVIEINRIHPGAYSNLGNGLWARGELEDALTICRHAVFLEPQNAKAQGNLGNVLRDLGRPDEALIAYKQCIELDPKSADAHLNMSLVLLSQGNYSLGWDEYEWRWECKDYLTAARNFAQPKWNGSPLQGRTLLVYVEQGFGDAIQFVRYLPLAAQRGGPIILECQPELTRLFRTIASGCQIISKGDPLPAFDLHCSLLSLPRLFNTTTNTIPAKVPYIFPDPDSARFWRQKVNVSTSTLKVGLAWAGNPNFKGDQTRSLTLDLLAPLAQVQGVKFFSLQKGASATQAKSPPTGLDLVDWSDDFSNFEDAALMVNLDLIISVDTSVAHLAGALDLPTWVMLQCVPDWRWMLDRKDSPWYPSTRLFRQPRRGDWNTVVANVAQALTLLVDGHCIAVAKKHHPA